MQLKGTFTIDGQQADLTFDSYIDWAETHTIMRVEGIGSPAFMEFDPIDHVYRFIGHAPESLRGIESEISQHLQSIQE